MGKMIRLYWYGKNGKGQLEMVAQTRIHGRVVRLEWTGTLFKTELEAAVTTGRLNLQVMEKIA